MFGKKKSYEKIFIVEGDSITIRTITRMGGRTDIPDVSFPMSKIRAINYQKPTFNYKGYIQLVVEGYDETTGETSVFFESNAEPTHSAIFEHIEKTVRQYHAEHPEDGIVIPERNVGLLSTVFGGSRAASAGNASASSSANKADSAAETGTPGQTAAAAGPENCSSPGQTAAAAGPELQAAEAIKKYKELLDMGAITQEEFDAKKKQLLGL